MLDMQTHKHVKSNMQPRSLLKRLQLPVIYTTHKSEMDKLNLPCSETNTGVKTH